MVDSPEGLVALLDQLEPAAEIAVDTEADSLHVYQEKLCLIQIAAGPACWIVDPLADLDIGPLLQLLGSRTLIFHGADYDLRMLLGAGMSRPPRLFDTMIAARLTGETTFNFAALVEKFAGVTLEKGSQKADWGKRPLSPKLLEYAANDARYLPGIATVLRERLIELGRLGWHDECCLKTQEKIESSLDAEPSPERWRITGANRLPPRSMAALRSLWYWREEKAKLRDRPVFHVLHNRELLELAEQVESNRPQLPARLRGSRKREVERLLGEARELPEAELPTKLKIKAYRATDEQNQRLDELKRQRDQRAKELELDPSLLASRKQLEDIVYRSLNPGEVLLPWQCREMGF